MSEPQRLSYRPQVNRVPVGIELVLYRAALDPGFRDALLNDRSAALTNAGYVLKSSEQAILDAASSAQLSGMIGRIDTQAPPRSKLMQSVQKLVLAAATTATLVTASGCILCTGHDTYIPPEDEWEQKDSTDVDEPEANDADDQDPGRDTTDTAPGDVPPGDVPPDAPQD